MFAAVMNVLSGFVLLVDMWDKIPAVGRWIDKGVRQLARIEAVIGILAITAGVLSFGWQGMLAICAGLALGFSAFRYIPAFGALLENLGQGLRAVKTTLGIVVFLIGMVGVI